MSKQRHGLQIRASVGSRTYGYDTQGRVNSVGETIAGSNFSTSFTFDSYGRLSTRTHPSGIVETLGYNTYGYMSTISAGGSIRYTLTSMNAREQLTGATYGSNLTATYGFDTYGYPSSTAAGTVQDYRYVFDATTGNLTSRQNYKRSKSESFTYDNLDRLLTVTGPQNLTMTFNANGNINTKSDISSTTNFGYGTNAGPYAITGVTSSTGVIPTTSQTATYTSFEKVSTLSEGVYAAAFIYNSDNQRAKMDVTQSGTNILTRWYAGGSYMKETAGGVTKEYTYIGGDAYTAPVAAVTQSGTTTYYYLLRDYLGNITHQVNTSNVVVAEYNFDAWGRRRSADDWSYTLDGNDLALFADRGFTGHETLSWFNLVNMNGRLYDPLVGRFLSADPYVQNAGLTQSYNRYSYCLNNPLRYTDPSGYTWGIFKPFVKFGKWVWNDALPAIDPDKAWTNLWQWVNDKTPKLRKKMSDAGIPDCGIGVNINGAGNVNANASIYGHEVFNSENIDRSGPSVKATNKMLTQVRQDYGPAWMEASGNKIPITSAIFGFSGVAGDMASMSNATFRLTNGAYNGSVFSPKYYPESPITGRGWTGGSVGEITTYGVSKVGSAVSFGAGVITTSMAYNEIYNGSPKSITYVDAGVGTVGVMSSIASYYSGIQIPYVGEGVAVYGTLRLTWDVFLNLGANYGPIGAYYGVNKWSGR